MAKFNRSLDGLHAAAILRAAYLWGCCAAQETDADVKTTYTKDAADLRRVASHLWDGRRACAADAAGRLDTLVRDQIPVRAWNYLLAMRS